MKVIFINIGHEFLTTSSFFPTKLFKRKKTKIAKRRASKDVRRSDDSYFDGCRMRSIKRFSDSYDIHDWVHVYYQIKSIDRLYDFLDKNSTIYTLWASSDERTKYKSLFVQNTIAFNAAYGQNINRRTFERLYQVMQLVETQCKTT